MPGRRGCLSKLIKAQLRRFHLSIIDRPDLEDTGALGSIRKIITTHPAVWMCVVEKEVPSLAASADKLGYGITILAHSIGEELAWVQLSMGKRVAHATKIKSRWWSRI